MKDLILISSHCDTELKEETLRNLVNQIHTKKDYFDIMVVSHTIIPLDIQDKCNYTYYDKDNELLYDWDLRSKPWFDPGNQRPILSIFTGAFSTHLAAWRIIIIGNSIAKSLGYKKVHHFEYDILFGTYQAYRLDTLHEELLVLNREKIKSQIKESKTKSCEGMLQDLLTKDRRFKVKPKNLLDQNGNCFGLSHNNDKWTAWCLPFYDKLTNELGFITWNMEAFNTIKVKLIYNQDTIVNVGEIKPHNWELSVIDPNYDNAVSLTVILNGKIRNEYYFDNYKEEFKLYSYREKDKR